MTREQCRACGKWFEDSELDAHLSEHMDDVPENEEDLGEEGDPLPQRPSESPLDKATVLDQGRSLSHSTEYSPEEAMSKADVQLRASGYDVRVQGFTLQALSEGRGKNYRWALVGLFFVIVISFYGSVFILGNLFLWLISIPAYLYRWFANRGQNRIVLTVTAGQFTIRYDGSTALRDAEQLSKVLQG